MKRDMDLVREILFRIEAADSLPKDLDLSFPNHDHWVVQVHLRLLLEAGLIRAINSSLMQSGNYLVEGLTWEGYDFLEAARDHAVWKQAKDLIAKKGGGMAFDVLKQLLVKLLSDRVL